MLHLWWVLFLVLFTLWAVSAVKSCRELRLWLHFTKVLIRGLFRLRQHHRTFSCWRSGTRFGSPQRFCSLFQEQRGWCRPSPSSRRPRRPGNSTAGAQAVRTESRFHGLNKHGRNAPQHLSSWWFYLSKTTALRTDHNKREDQADEEKAEPVDRSCDHESSRASRLSEELRG